MSECLHFSRIPAWRWANAVIAGALFQCFAPLSVLIDLWLSTNNYSVMHFD